MNGFPRPRTSVPEFDPIVDAWARSSEFHELNAPATEDDLAAVEELLGRAFPPAFRALFEVSDGASYLQGNLMVERLLGGSNFESVATTSDDVREAGAPLPDEVVVFGGDGSEAGFGIWLPRGRIGAAVPVVEIGEGGGGLALVGTDLPPFLRGWTAYYLVLIEADPTALEALSLPHDLRIPAEEADDALFAALRKWADPSLPNHDADPYKSPTSVGELRRLYGSGA